MKSLGRIAFVIALTLSGTVAAQSLNSEALLPAMIVIPAGSFVMGSRGYNGDEQPAHRVTIKAFALGKYDVTQDEWTAAMGSNPSFFKGGNRPVDSVRWDDAQKFIQILNKKTGKSYRLPTEAEWEYAARAGSAAAYAFGEDDSQLGLYAWYSENSGGETHSVGEKLPNMFGLYDMHGNVWQWVQDCYVDNYINARNDGGATVGQAACHHVLRGASWFGDAEFLRSAYRSEGTPGYRGEFLGFRLAMTLP